jgi:hypothetical protein
MEEALFEELLGNNWVSEGIPIIEFHREPLFQEG